MTGKQLIWGYDVDGRPTIYMYPSRQNTDSDTEEQRRRQLQFAIWNMEMAFDLMPIGVETVVLMVDFTEKAKSPSMSNS